jgi:hypothetical protein
MIRRAALVLAAVLSVAMPVHAEFSDLAHALDARLGNRTWVPMLGFARMIVRIIEPQGVKDFQLAVFEDAPRVEGRELEQLMQRHVGKGFTPLVRVRSHQESSFVYARPMKGDRMELTVLTQDGKDTVLVRVAVSAEAVAKQLGNAHGVTALARR